MITILRLQTKINAHKVAGLRVKMCVKLPESVLLMLQQNGGH